MRRELVIFAMTFFILSACTSPGSMPTGEESPLESPLATPTLTPVPTLKPSASLVPQLVNDLADRLNISRDQIALQGLRPVVWRKDDLQCPPPLDTSVPLEHVMIVTEDGARYEPPTRDLKPGKDTALLVLLSAGEKTYCYYKIENRFLFCPNR